MGTRSVIAIAQGDIWEGRYCHWDGYPSGVGQTLWHAYHNYFEHDLAQMMEYFTVKHNGWSIIAGKDFSLEPGFNDRWSSEALCQCGQPNWRHYAQHYPEHGLPEPPHPPGDYSVLGHAFVKIAERRDQRPECYCHGDRHEEDPGFIRRDGDSWGTEYAYAFHVPGRIMTIERILWNEETQKYTWVPLWSGHLDGEEPDWDTLDRANHTVRFFGQ